ncbi:MAG: hypothetical protein ACRDGV_13545 [Candidatus Limnocylindria bacterium]
MRSRTTITTARRSNRLLLALIAAWVAASLAIGGVVSADADREASVPVTTSDGNR